LATDESGRTILVNFQRRILLNEINLKCKVRDMQFSPDGKFFAVTTGHLITVWHSPSLRREFSPFVQYATYPGHQDDVTCIQWSPDSR
jgi:periodic tryptophan protein 2